jgi:hypothetical protein
MRESLRYVKINFFVDEFELRKGIVFGSVQVVVVPKSIAFPNSSEWGI